MGAGEASAAVAALLSLISPMPYSADFRPFFTIHDTDFGALASGQLPDSSNALPRLLGVTNLYFLKANLSLPKSLSLRFRCKFFPSQRIGFEKTERRIYFTVEPQKQSCVKSILRSSYVLRGRRPALCSEVCYTCPSPSWQETTTILVANRRSISLFRPSDPTILLRTDYNPM